MTKDESQELTRVLTRQFGKVNSRLDGIDNHFEGIDSNLDGINHKLSVHDFKFDRMTERLEAIDEKFEKKFDKVYTILDTMKGTLDATVIELTAHSSQLSRHEAWIHNTSTTLNLPYKGYS